VHLKEAKEISYFKKSNTITYFSSGDNWKIISCDSSAAITIYVHGRKILEIKGADE
jgi:hypothetical protein